MDKETLSNYGWIVICVLVLAVMLAFATPFGNFIADAVKSTTQGLFDVNQSALNSTGLINIDGQEFESCEHDYEVTTTANCTTAGTTTHTCKLCGKSYSEGTPAGHTWDDTGLTCIECSITAVEYAFKASDYDAKMGTSTATDAVVIIPETFECNGKIYKVTSIRDHAFRYCTALSSITIPNSVTSIGISAFSGCTSLTSITLPIGVTQIGNTAFMNCESLKTIDFSRCENLTIIYPDAFKRCNSLEYIDFSKCTNLTKIDQSVFSECTVLRDIVFPHGLTTIASQAFNCCFQLTSITIPNSVKNIGSYTFTNCNNLINVTYNGTIEQWNTISLDSNWWKSNTKITEVICSNGTVSLS